MTALSISNPSDLESLVTSAIYSSLLTGRLSPASSPPSVTVISVAPLRDVKPQSVSRMISVLSDWEARCGAVIGEIETEIANIKARAEKEKAKEKARVAVFEKALNGSMDDKGTEVGAGGRGGRRSRFGGGGVGNKREFSSDDYDDGYLENGGDGGFDADFGGRMDIDEGAGSSSSRAAAGARQAKRVLGGSR